MAENLNLKTIETVDTRPFKKLVMTIGELPTSFIESMTYYELLAWFVNYLETVIIPTVNNNAEAVRELQQKFIDLSKLFEKLQKFVDEYFDNLDVQDEINNKLDDMVADGTLQSIVDTYLESMTKKVEYIFPKNWEAFSGDANLIKGYGKTILIDTFTSGSKDDLYEMLNAFNANHIDYLILTHYHPDHIGNTINLINDGYVDSDTFVYLPPDCQQIIDSPELTATKNEIILALHQNNIQSEIPLENSKLTIDPEFEITFYNTDFSALSNFTNYNNCSTLCKIYHNGKRSLYTGDALGQALNRAFSNKFIDNHIDLYKVEHHAIEYNNAAVNMLSTIIPTFAYVPAFIKDAEKNNYSISTTLAYLQSKGTQIYASYLSSEYIVFQSAFGNMSVIQGTQANSISNNNNVNQNTFQLFVDASTTNTVQDGRLNTPFKDLSQAIGACTKTSAGRTELVLSEGTYCVTHDSEVKNNTLANGIDIQIRKSSSASSDNVIIQGECTFFNSKIFISDVSFINKDTTSTNLSLNNCNVELSNVKFNGANATNPTCIWSTKSKLYIHDCEASNYNMFVSVHNDEITSYNNTFNTINTAIYNRGGVSIGSGNTYANVNAKIVKENGAINSSNLIQLYTGSATSGTITLSDDIRKYNKMIVITGALGAGTLYSDTIYPYLPNMFVQNNTYNFKTIDGYYKGQIGNDGKSITLTANNTSYPVRKIIVEYVNTDILE